MTLTLPYPPGSNRLWRSVRGRTVLSAEAIAWKQTAAWHARAVGCPLLAGNVAVALVLHPRLTKTGRASQTRLDVDGGIKITLDALQGLAYANDKQVTRLSAQIGLPRPAGGLTVSVCPDDLPPGDDAHDHGL